MVLSEEEQQEVARRYRQQKLEEQRKQVADSSAQSSDSKSQPQESTPQNDTTPQISQQDTRPRYRFKRKASKEEIKKGASQLKKITGETKQELGIVGSLLIGTVAVFATFIDILPLVTGELSTFVDWIFDIMFFIALSFTTMIVTKDIFGSMIGKKGMVNAIQTIVEFIPVIDIIPFHMLAVVIITLDIKYNILSFTKKLSGQQDNITNFPQKTSNQRSSKLDKAA